MEKQYYEIARNESSERVKIENSADWLKQKETSFYQKNAEKEYCFFSDVTEELFSTFRNEITSLAYSLNSPNTLSNAARVQYVVRENELLSIRTFYVIREGQYIDKLADIEVKVMDNQISDNGSMLENGKNIVVLVPDLHLKDILVTEVCIRTEYKKGSLYHKYCDYFYGTADSYWCYGEKTFRIVNHTENELICGHFFDRDKRDERIDVPSETISGGETFEMIEREVKIEKQWENMVAPFSKISTKAEFPEIATDIAKMYEPFFQVNLQEFAPEFAAELDKCPSLEHKIQKAIDFVQKEIYYLYNGSEMDGHEPQAAEITYQKRRGDCKAKAVLLKIILQSIGIDSSVILVNRDMDIFLPMINPSPLIFNHAILKIYFNQKEYFVDPTLNYDFGFLENRESISIMYYLEVEPEAELKKQEPFVRNFFEVDETTEIDVQDELGTVTQTEILRGNVANFRREIFRVETQEQILRRYNLSMYQRMVIESFEEDDIEDYFIEPTVTMLDDDRELNQLTIVYKVKIKSPYSLRDSKGKRYLRYWDREDFLDSEVENYNHKDLPYWLDRRKAKAAIHMNCDYPIDQKEPATCQECEIKSDFIQHTMKKEIRKNGASCYIETIPYHNAAISGKDFKKYERAMKQIYNSNWGIGIDLIEGGFFKRLFMKWKN